MKKYLITLITVSILLTSCRFTLLADMRIQGQIDDDDDLKSRLDDEKLLLDSELHDVAIISKEIAQNAANGAIDVLPKTILAAIKL